MESVDTLPPEKIAFIAYNSGCIVAVVSAGEPKSAWLIYNIISRCFILLYLPCMPYLSNCDTSLYIIPNLVLIHSAIIY
jgi:hypothetical protein